MRVLVTGGRHFSDRSMVFNTLDKLNAQTAIELIIHGGADGVDEFARRWALYWEIPHLCHPAKWRTGGRGKSEGPIRNKEMLKWEPDLVVAFPGGYGTTNMRRTAVEAGIEVKIVGESPE